MGKNISICGSHGVGKTTVINLLKIRHPEFSFVSESTRLIMPELGFNNPYAFVDKFGIAFYESIIMGQWSVLTQLRADFFSTLIMDRSPIDNLAYYFLLRTEEEKAYESVMTNLCKFFCKYIDLYLFIPTGVFKLNPDAMQVVETQYELETIIKWLFYRFDIGYHIIMGESVEQRCAEIESCIFG